MRMTIPIVICALRKIPKRLVKGLEDLETKRQVETIQNTEKSPGHFRKLVVTQTPVNDFQ